MCSRDPPEGRRVKLAQAALFALSLPEVVEAPHHELSSFRVRGRIFATVPPDGAHLHVMLDEQHGVDVASTHAGCELLHWGRKVAGVRVTLARAKAAEVHALLHAAWSRKAPKALVAAWDAEHGRD
ncbi:MAG: MmcQ/YjbR family DNA-binding protein [Myxococcales bacterium]|nr:MmcQ/YjbR family DNA-binding protein [Myxococcales bacterium]